jgi:hypothetical protein
MDVYKDSSQKNKSVAAFVASINGTQENKYNCTKYFSRSAIQSKGEEFSNCLNTFMIGKTINTLIFCYYRQSLWFQKKILLFSL